MPETDTAVAVEPQAAAPETDNTQQSVETGGDDAYLAQFADEPAPEVQTPKAEPKQAEAPTSRENPQDVERAMRAFQRDGLSAKAINQLMKDDTSEFVRTGLKRSKAQSDADRFGSEHGELKKKIAELEKAKAEGVKPQPAAPSLVTPELQQMYPELGPVFNAYEPRMQAMQTAFDAKLAEILPSIEGRVNFVGQLAVGQELKAARAALKETYPKLADSAEFETVRDEANKLLSAGLAEDIHSAIEKASQLRYFHETMQSGQRARETLEKAKTAGQPAAPSVVGKSPKAMSQADKDSEFLRIAEAKGIDAATEWLRTA